MLDSISNHEQDERSEHGPLALFAHIAKLNRRWRELSEEFLPVCTRSDLWRYSRKWLATDPQQGWKIHVSATILSACDVFEAIAKHLTDIGVLFKALVSLDELAKLNSGLWYGYSQVGKFITIYPLNEEQFREIVDVLLNLLPENPAAPAVPFDLRLRPASNIFYRYGGFVTKPLVNESGSEVPAIMSPDGKMLEDRRDIPAPDWAAQPFDPDRLHIYKERESPLATRYRVFSSISQRGKGGVYEAIDMQSIPPRTCIVKEGRRHGETAWDGRDGRDRIKHEVAVLCDLNKQEVNVPIVVDSFEADGNFYLVLEEINGESLRTFVAKQKRRLSIGMAIEIGRNIAGFMAELHAAGWVWRDCKPANFFVLSDRSVRAIDFEGATRVHEPDPMPWNTPSYSPPEILAAKKRSCPVSNLPEDLYALGVCLFFIFEGKPLSNNAERPPTDITRKANKSCRSGIPASIQSLISRLLSEYPDARPTAQEVFETLDNVERHLAKKIRKPHVVANGIENGLDLYR